MKTDKISLERISKLHPDFRNAAGVYLEKINNVLLGTNVLCRITRGYATPEEQNALYAQGRTKPGAIVTNAKAWESMHCYGLAFDIALILDKDKNGTFETLSYDTILDFDKDGMSDWLEITNYLVKQGLQNGFITNGKHWDKPHFQINVKDTVYDLKEKIIKGQSFLNNGLIYPKL